jgi:hypothetical protein
MSRKYRILFLGISVDEDQFRSQMGLLGVGSDSVNRIVRNSPVILKQDLTLEFAGRYANAIRKAGGIVEVRAQYLPAKSPGPSISIASFRNFTMCPKCGLKQQRNHACVRCGFRFAKMEKALEPNNVAGH